MTSDRDVGLRRKPDARVVEHSRGVAVYLEPHIAPVLPAGWAPLNPADQASVLHACDDAPEACRLRFGSVWDAATEYRVYRLESEGWRGVCAATLFGPIPERRASAASNIRLLAVAQSIDAAARVALDFVNWDLEADGLPLRLTLRPVS